MSSTHEDPSTCTLDEPALGNVFVAAYPPFSCWHSDAVAQVEQVLDTPSAARDEPLGLYVHIPFCLQRCNFCYYRSIAEPDPGLLASYLDALERELDLVRRRPRLAGRELTYLYFGGGTPSLLSPEQIDRLFAGIGAAFPGRAWQEATFECSPKTATRLRLEALRRAGITRISLGVQQLNDDVLRQNGRVHLVEDVFRAYAEIRRINFDTVNLDLMVGLVGETDSTFDASLHEVLAMGPDSITFYQLEIPRNTPLFRAWQSDQVADLADWETKRRRLDRAFTQAERAGYPLRSAYAAVRDPAQHPFLYQDLQYRGADLVGTGLSAFSYVAGAHYQNMSSLRGYRECLAENRLPLQRGYLLSAQDQLVREFVLQLKLGQVELAAFRQKFGVEIGEQFRVPLDRFAAMDWLTIDRGAIRLTRAGRLRVDQLLPEFYSPQYRAASYW